jgi:hypothetical protein
MQGLHLHKTQATQPARNLMKITRISCMTGCWQQSSYRRERRSANLVEPSTPLVTR